QLCDWSAPLAVDWIRGAGGHYAAGGVVPGAGVAIGGGVRLARPGRSHRPVDVAAGNRGGGGARRSPCGNARHLSRLLCDADPGHLEHAFFFAQRASTSGRAHRAAARPGVGMHGGGAGSPSSRRIGSAEFSDLAWDRLLVFLSRIVFRLRSPRRATRLAAAVRRCAISPRRSSLITKRRWWEAFAARRPSTMVCRPRRPVGGLNELSASGAFAAAFACGSR